MAPSNLTQAMKRHVKPLALPANVINFDIVSFLAVSKQTGGTTGNYVPRNIYSDALWWFSRLQAFEKNATMPYFFLQDLRFNATAYTDVPDTMLKFCIKVLYFTCFSRTLL